MVDHKQQTSMNLTRNAWEPWSLAEEAAANSKIALMTSMGNTSLMMRVSTKSGKEEGKV
jgi:hypothetical protein